MEMAMHTPDELKALFKRAGWSYKDAADALGACESTICKWANGEDMINDQYWSLLNAAATLQRVRVDRKRQEIAARFKSMAFRNEIERRWELENEAA
jgi:transcriptional regulator with XRE-family HTH domain